jgi:hypothetical protein
MSGNGERGRGRPRASRPDRTDGMRTRGRARAESEAPVPPAREESQEQQSVEATINRYEYLQDMAERIDAAEGNDSDEEFFAEEGHFSAANQASREREEHNHVEVNAGRQELEFTPTPDRTIIPNFILLPGVRPGDAWVPPGRPANERVRPRDAVHHEPPYRQLDNPGGWSNYSFQAVFAKTPQGKKGEYLRHELPCGATVIPEDENGQRMVEGWTAHYQGFDLPENSGRRFRDGATRNNIFPEIRHSKLNLPLLKKIGLSKERMSDADGNPDALFFLMIYLPVHDTTKTFDGDPRISWYPKAATWTNSYAAEIGALGSAYGGTTTTATDPIEQLHWDGTLVRAGCRGGADGGFWQFFVEDDYNPNYDPLIAAFGLSRWKWCKRCYHCCSNEVARGIMETNPEALDVTYKYNEIYKVLVHNTNAVTLKACDDQVVDECSTAYGGYGPADTGIIARRPNKPGLSRGAQTVLSMDADHFRVRAYVHRHNRHPKHFSLPGNNEMYLLHQQILKRPDIFRLHDLHMLGDNFFSGMDWFKYVCEQNFGTLTTTRRDRLPIKEKQYLHHKKLTAVTPRSKAARFENPIVLTKEYKGSLMVHCSMQSTGSCNFTGVNSFEHCHRFVAPKERGRDTESSSKRRWYIEMNEPRQLYCSEYGKIDTLDHYLRNCHIGYRSWKYWPSIVNTGKKITLVEAWDTYMELSTGKDDPELFVEAPVGFNQFRNVCSVQMMKYDPCLLKYVGDEYMRRYTKQPMNRRVGNNPQQRQRPNNGNFFSPEYFQLHNNRLCGDLGKLTAHLKTVQKPKSVSSRKCVVCGLDCYSKCGKCDEWMHIDLPKGASDNQEVGCFFYHHNSTFLGLTKNDFYMLNNDDGSEKRKKNYEFPSAEERAQHAQKCRGLYD